MAGIGKTVSGTKEIGFDHNGFPAEKPSLCRTVALRTPKRTRSRRKIGSPAPDYLTAPAEITSVQEKIDARGDVELVCRILAALNQLFPLNVNLKQIADPQEIVRESLQNWMKSFLPENIYEYFDMSLQILGREVARYLDYDFYDADAVISFGIPEFVHDYYPLGEVLKKYEEQYPGLLKHIMRMLSDCPIAIGTPEAVYELTSCLCWGFEADEKYFYEERLEEYMDAGESEEEARRYIEEMIPVTYADFENNLPEWTFKREERNSRYEGDIPLELQDMQRCYKRWRRRNRPHYDYPNSSYPPMVVALDKDSYDFCCETIDRVGYEFYQCGDSFETTHLYWSIKAMNQHQITAILLELRYALEYFAACINFLTPYKQEYPNNA